MAKVVSKRNGRILKTGNRIYLAESACCCDEAIVSCIIFEDDFNRIDSSNIGSNWLELVGDWEIISNKLVIDSTNASVQCQTEHSSSDMAVIVNVKGFTSGDKVRVCVRMTDENNYLCAELVYGASSSTFNLFERLTGSDGSAKDTDVTTFVVTGDEVKIVVCVQGGLLNAVLYDTNESPILDLTGSVSASSEKHAGLSTGDTITTQVTFNDFILMSRNDKCQSCGKCAAGNFFTDDFSTYDSRWVLFGNAEVSGGQLKMDILTLGGFTPQAWRCTPTPASLDFSIEGTVVRGNASKHGTSGMSFKSGQTSLQAVWPDPFFGGGQYIYTTAVGASGPIFDVPADGDVLKITIEDEGAGTHFTQKFYINGTLKITETNVPISFADAVQIELACTARGSPAPYDLGAWDDVSLLNSI